MLYDARLYGALGLPRIYFMLDRKKSVKIGTVMLRIEILEIGASIVLCISNTLNLI
jgi:hypothetical protein